MRNAYWDYVFAVQSVDVAKQSVDLAMQLVKDNQTRVEVGTMAPIDVVQGEHVLRGGCHALDLEVRSTKSEARRSDAAS